jgi:hypothetical protein
MLGFETVGNATCIVHDDVPVLTTDAWTGADAYYGSWTLDYEIPCEALHSIRRARYHWFSHGHPDHLNVRSLPELSSGCLLLSDHRGGRMLRDLRGMGLHVRVLPDRRWVPLSRRVAVYSIANQNQDSVLLVRVGDQLVIDLNDAPDFGASFHIRRIARRFRVAYLLALHSWGAVDMTNVYDAAGHRMSFPAERRLPLGRDAQRCALAHGAHRVIPFSTFHRYQRTDSAWANAWIPALADYAAGALPGGPDVLPAFVRVDCARDTIEPLSPPRREAAPRPPRAFGDDASDPLDLEDRRALDAYFLAHAHLRRRFGFLLFRVGGSEHGIRLNPRLPQAGIAFEAPRNSLMHAVTHRVFDDLLIGNFMKVHLHGVRSLYPDFTPFVAKYGDNGDARSRTELWRYFGHYVLRDPVGYALHCLRTPTEQVMRP